MKIGHTLSAYAMAAYCAATPAFAQTNPAATAHPPTAEAAQKKVVNHDAAALADFKKRVDDYLMLRDKVAKSVPAVKATNDVAEINRNQEGLLEALRAARADAKPGDIFTPEIRTVFRKVLRPELKGEDGKDAKAVLKDDAPPTVPLKVNSKYPEGATRPTTPAAVLANLPSLPKQLEYRLINGHLILFDIDATMIVDYIPNAITT